MSVARLMQMGAAGVPAGGGVVWTNPDLANASYDSVSFSVAGQEANPAGLAFSEDGTRFYVTGTAGDDINEYSLSTAWDITSATFVQAFLVQTQDNLPQDVFFGDSGSKMFVVGTQNDSVYRYDLSTAYDVSTASYVSTFSVATQNTTPSGLFFKADGTKMYVVGQTSPQSIYQYTLSTAWDITSAVFTSSFSVSGQEIFPKNIFFSPDGTKLFNPGGAGDDVNEYDLSTSWDISTASFLRSFSVASQETSPTGLWFKSDGSKMYVMGSATDTIYQYSTA